MLVRRGFAVLLGLLIVTPFTTPFSSCPLSLLLHDPVASPASPPSGFIVTATEDDDVPPSDTFSVQIEEKIKDETTLDTVKVSFVPAVVSFGQRERITDRSPVTPLVPPVLRV